MTENRWQAFTDDEIAVLFDALGEAVAGGVLFDEVKAELERRRPDDERLLIALGDPQTDPDERGTDA